MITTPTVLILGAGASKPFGFPTGGELYWDVIHLLENVRVNQFPLWSVLRRNPSEPERFREALFYSGQTSVDAFLENRPEFIDVGRLLIARVLLPYEAKDLHSQEKEKNEEKWYKYLFDKMKAPKGAFDENQISFITFNYDSTLEHFLFTSLCHSYNMSQEECAKQLAGIPIIHVHGQLGHLPWQKGLIEPLRQPLPFAGGRDDSVVPYYRDGMTRSEENVEAIARSAQFIRIISEGDSIENDPQLKKAHELLDNAKVVAFLGFGYNATNMKRLRLGQVAGRQVFGSSYGMVPAEIARTKSAYNIGLLADSTWGVLRFLRETVPLS